MDAIYELQAEACKTLANARRLEIIHILATGPREVGRLAAEMGASQPNVSQHLAVMKAAGIVEAERFGREIHYRLADPDVVRACDLMRGVLRRRLARLAGLSTASPEPGDRPAPTSPSSASAAADEPLATVSR